ncbi:unnamed protein product [Cylindrotheca closterium]|uniref:SOUL heme-binding protein n=1 Tax=Cylindrotheca closterium TaxID=2856 RepID=A0AAD2JKK8_9STRA|nr:unnamed protein product [Cylindrotheca closterium]
MGSVFGKQTVAEPFFEVLLDRNQAQTQYELRHYPERRYAATCVYDGDADDTSPPFRALANYIGVFGKPQNESRESISATTPIVYQGSTTKGESIAMTAPVVTEEVEDGKRVMKFMLPAEYDELSKVPKPINPAVKIEEIPPQVGVVHKYKGSLKAEHNKEMAIDLADQLMADGVEGISEEFVLDNFQFWGYNPPMTIPYLRRNEVWLQLTEEQVEYLTQKYNNRSLN